LGDKAYLLAGHVDVGDFVVLTHNGDVGDDIDGGDITGQDANAACGEGQNITNITNITNNS
jgi:hypothetical protein